MYDYIYIGKIIKNNFSLNSQERKISYSKINKNFFIQTKNLKQLYITKYLLL